MMARKKDDLNRDKIPSYLRELILFLTYNPIWVMKYYPKQAIFQAAYELQKGRTQTHIAPSSFAVSKMASCGACEKFGEPHLQQDHL